MTRDEKLVIEGGKVKFLTQKRQLEASDQAGVIVDTLRFNVSEMYFRGDLIPDDTDSENLAFLLALHFGRLLGFAVGDKRPGRDYYDFSTTIVNENGSEVGSVSAGGESQRGTVCFSLKGEGCTNALPGWQKRVYEAFAPFHPKVTRVDLARDFFDGEVTVDDAVAAYKDHAFSYQNRKPKLTMIGDWIANDSRTFQVGKRESGKLCRIYEKDHQYGIMDGKWVRVEVELRSEGRVIPWDVLILPGEYFAGAYEWCKWVSGVEVASKIPTAAKVASNGAAAAVRWLRMTVAPLLVQISGHMPDFDWLADIVLAERHRPMPKSLRGIQPHQLKQGLSDALSFMSMNARAPAAISF